MTDKPEETFGPPGLDLKSLKRPQNINAICTYLPMQDAYQISLRWEWLGKKYGYDYMIASSVSKTYKEMAMQQMVKNIVDENEDWNGQQATYFVKEAGTIIAKVSGYLETGKTNIFATPAEVKWATGNKTAKKLQSGGTIQGANLYVNDGLVVGQTTPNIAEIAKTLPGVMTKVPIPQDCLDNFCSSNTHEHLYYWIQHLNDHHRWKREKIADWIDELHDAGLVNTEFQPWGEDGSTNSDDCATLEESVNDEPTTLTPVTGVAEAVIKLGEEETTFPKDWTGWQDLGYTTDEGLETTEADFDQMTLDEIFNYIEQLKKSGVSMSKLQEELKKLTNLFDELEGNNDQD